VFVLEQDAISKTAVLCTTTKLKVEWPIIAYYFDSIKRSPVVGSLAVSNKVRQFLVHEDCHLQNIFPAAGNATKETVNARDDVYTSGWSE
jgi:hypothetical protein